jgi:putative transcriptional regulator
LSSWRKPRFSRVKAQDVWEEAERAAFVDFIAQNPDAGDVIPETGGVRKIRWARAGTGKRGGARVVYFYHDRGRPLYLFNGLYQARGKEGRAQAGNAAQELRQQARKGTEMAKFGDELIESMRQAAAHARGRKVRGMRVTRVDIPDVKAIRRSLRMSQLRFAAAYRIPLPTLKNWEQGRRHPDAPAAAYLLAIKRRPKEIMEAVAR